MDKQAASTQQVIDEMVRRIVTTSQPLRIILFGSHARSNAGIESDVDLLVVMPDGTAKRPAALKIRAVLAGVGLPKDVVVTTPSEINERGNLVGTVLRPALHDGKVLYTAG